MVTGSVGCSVTARRNPHQSPKDLVALTEGKVLVKEESLTSILSGQDDDIMVECIERETLYEISLKVRLEEIVPPLEEIPSVVKMDALQLRKVVILIFGAENIVESSCRKDGSGANGTSDKLVALAGDEIQDG